MPPVPPSNSFYCSQANLLARLFCSKCYLRQNAFFLKFDIFIPPQNACYLCVVLSFKKTLLGVFVLSPRYTCGPLRTWILSPWCPELDVPVWPSWGHKYCHLDVPVCSLRTQILLPWCFGLDVPAWPSEDMNTVTLMYLVPPWGHKYCHPYVPASLRTGIRSPVPCEDMIQFSPCAIYRFVCKVGVSITSTSCNMWKDGKETEESMDLTSDSPIPRGYITWISLSH